MTQKTRDLFSGTSFSKKIDRKRCRPDVSFNDEAYLGGSCSVSSDLYIHFLFVQHYYLPTENASTMQQIYTISVSVTPPRYNVSKIYKAKPIKRPLLQLAPSRHPAILHVTHVTNPEFRPQTQIFLIVFRFVLAQGR